MKKTIYLIILIFTISSCLNQQKSTQGLLSEILNDEEYKKMDIYAWSFIPQLSDSLKNDQNFLYTMDEVKDKSFDLFFNTKNRTPLINWKNYKIRNKVVEFKNQNTLQISTPLFIQNDSEALVQIKTNYADWYNVYKYQNGRWNLSYGFGNKTINPAAHSMTKSK